MIVATSTGALQDFLNQARRDGKRIGFVPTMGNLHDGHARLLDAARQYCDCVAASVYVNPLQFGPREDFTSYPRTPEQDRALLQAHGTDIVFFPDDASMYPRGREAHTRVTVPGVSDILCGALRPGHFHGVTTVVNRLFNLVQPDRAFFGKKDYQQLLLIRLMVADLAIPVAVHGIDTVRAADGLALSSRNGYLTQEERRIAPTLYAALKTAAQRMQAGETVSAVEAGARDALAAAGFAPEYVSVRRQSDLAPPAAGDRELAVLAAARLGRARLIDNLEVSLNIARPGP